MDTTLIYQALEQPALRKAIPIEELERIKAEYPYFTAAHILLAKIYQENNDHRFSDQVQNAALYAGDRTVLYRYLKDASLQDARPAGLLQDAPTELRDTPAGLRDKRSTPYEEEVREEDFALISADELEIFGEKEREIELVQEREREQEREQERELELELEQELVLEQEEEATAETLNPELQTLNPEHETLNSEPRTLNPELDELSRNILIEAVHSSIEQEVGMIELDNEKQNQIENELSRESDSENLSFAELMVLRAKKAHYGEDASLQDARPAGLQDAPAELRDTPAGLRDLGEEEEQEQELEDERRSYEYLYKLQNGGLAPLGGADKREKQRNLIDRFIQTEPKITPGKAAEYTAAANVGKDSLEEDFSFATETMAKLFVQQGKLDKARKVYRKLMQLHPEKSVYFATQLKNLNQFKK